MNFAVRRSIGVAVAAGAVAIGLTACAGIREHRDLQERNRVINVPPDNYKADLAAFMRTYLNDPTGIRDAVVAEPTLTNLGGQQRYASCMRFNAKTSDGRYTGSREALALYARGRFEQLVEQPRDQTSRDLVRELCAGANYQPFPELEALKR